MFLSWKFQIHQSRDWFENSKLHVSRFLPEYENYYILKILFHEVVDLTYVRKYKMQNVAKKNTPMEVRAVAL